MSREDLLKYFKRRLKESEDSLVQFQLAIIDHGLRVRERDVNGERDITDRCLKEEVAACDEYRRLIDEWSSSSVTWLGCTTRDTVCIPIGVPGAGRRGPQALVVG